MRFKLYQIKKSLISTGTYIFMDFDFAKKHDLTIKDYDVVYEGDITPSKFIEDTLEAIYMKFNVDRPQDFKGHSLSVSDIIEINDEFYYTEGLGFKNITNDLLQ